MKEINKFVFPPDFLWGASTSAHQVEGGNRNQWSEWEKKHAERLAAEAPQNFRFLPAELMAEAAAPENYISGQAVDHYHRYSEDFALMEKMGMNAARFSIEWSRIEPQEGTFDEEEMEHYRSMLKDLQNRDITPFVTLWHWTEPIWFTQKGGWKNLDAPYFFQKFVEKIISTLGDLVSYWIPLNEPEVYAANSYLFGHWPPQEKSFFSCQKVRRNLIRAHILAYEMIKKIAPQAEVGIAHALAFMAPYHDIWVNRVIANLVSYFSNEYFLRKISKELDFIGVNYYFRTVWDWFHRREEKRPISDLGWELYPEGIFPILRNVQKFKKPLYITENGLADAADSRRGKYLQSVLQNVAKAIEVGIDVRGYMHWSLLDNFEWDKGFWPRFGLIEIDYKNNLARKVRKSGEEYAEIIRNGIPLEEEGTSPLFQK